MAVQVAAALNAPLDIMPVVDLSTPGKPEYVVGAVAENAIHVIDADALAALGVTEDSLAQRVAEATAQIARLAKIYRGADGSALHLDDRTVMVVDDGSATVPALEAVAVALSRRTVGELVLATPMSPAPGCTGIHRSCRCTAARSWLRSGFGTTITRRLRMRWRQRCFGRMRRCEAEALREALAKHIFRQSDDFSQARTVAGRARAGNRANSLDQPISQESGVAPPEQLEPGPWSVRPRTSTRSRRSTVSA